MLNVLVFSEILEWAQFLALHAAPDATLDCMRAFFETDFRRDLGAFDMPTLIIHGDADQTVPIDASARKAARMIGGARLLQYDGAPHGLFYTHKDKLNADLLAFARE